MDKEIIIVATVVSLTLLIFVVVFLFLLVSRANRKNRHRADLADLRLQMSEEVRTAEREATQSTMSCIGRELHDNIGQLLTAAQLSFMHRFDEEMDNDEQLSSINLTLEESINEVRRLGRTLNTDIWKDRTLIESISDSAAHIERLGLGIAHVKQSGTEADLEPAEKVILFRTFQEVINNAFKHGKAKKVEIELIESPFLLRVSDDGIGFDEQSMTKGSGLLNIRKRCEMIGFGAELITAKGKGCTWKFFRQ